MAKYYIISGEASGDLHGANLIKEIKKLDVTAEFRGFGGNKMQDAGCKVTLHYKDIAYMGFKEVLMHLGTISKALKTCKEDILSFQPDAVILIDYPGFNFRVASFAHQNQFKVIYYIAPQLWAWKEKRIEKLKKFTDKVITILPFEKDFYKARGLDVAYAGHPLVDEVKSFRPSDDFIHRNKLTRKPIIAVLPGSREQEIEKILPRVSPMAKLFPDYQFVIGGSEHFPVSYYQKFSQGGQLPVIFGQTYDLLYHAHAGLIKSGTSTLEAALFKLPMVVCYATTGTSYHIFKHFAKVKYISLVNLILDKAAVSELIQKELNQDNLKAGLEKIIIDSPGREKMLSDFDQLEAMLHEQGASRQAAKLILETTAK